MLFYLYTLDSIKLYSYSFQSELHSWSLCPPALRRSFFFASAQSNRAELCTLLSSIMVCISPEYPLTSSTNPPQAHRIVSQVVFTGARVFGRAFTEAYKQASASSKYAAQASQGNMGGANTFASSGLTFDEACRILNVKPPQGGEANVEQFMERFKKLFDLNDPQKGGSFYLQSKILRARERIEMELRQAERKAAHDKELREGWKPKVYKDR